jgi:hypothetical protein
MFSNNGKYICEALSLIINSFTFNSQKFNSLYGAWCLPVFVGYAAFLLPEHAPLQRLMEQRE